MQLTSVVSGLVLLTVVLGTAPARGQQSSTLATADFTLTLQRPEGDKWVDLSVVDAQAYLNQARCLCDSPVRILVKMASLSRDKLAQPKPGAYARLYAGINCATLTPNNQPTCPDGLLGTLKDLSTFSSTGAWAVNTTASRLFGGGREGCAQTRVSTVWLWVDSQGTGIPDLSGSSAPSLGMIVDGTPPPAPKGIVAEGADQSLQLSWNPMDVDLPPDLNGYLVFCMRGDGLPVFDPGFYKDQYTTGFTMCGAGAPATSGPDPMVSAAGDTTAVEIDAPQPFQDLDPRYLCSNRISPADLRYRLNGLQNDVPFTVGIAAVDISGNASPIRKAFVQKSVAGLDPLPDPDAGTTDAGATKLGKAGCECHLAGAVRDESQIAWIGMLGLGLVLRLRRRSNPRVSP